MNKRILLCLIIFVSALQSFGRCDFTDNYSKGVNHYLNGNNEAALLELEKAYRKNPDSRKVKVLLAEVLVIVGGKHFREDDTQEAFDLIARARKLKPGDKKIEQVYDMLDRKLHPGKFKVKKLKESGENPFDDITAREEKKRDERIRIIKAPPEKITVQQRELLRPIIMNDGKDDKLLYIVAGFTGLVLLVFMAGTVFWMKQMAVSGRKNFEAVSSGAEEKMKKLEAELKALRKREGNNDRQVAGQKKKTDRKLRIQEEKIKNEYAGILKETLKGRSVPAKNMPEPDLSPSEQEKGREEIVASFKKLKEKNYDDAALLLKRMSADRNPWERLWVGELAETLKPEDAIVILKPLAGDREYQVKKKALKVLRVIMDRGQCTSNQKAAVRTIIDGARDSQWIV